MRNTVLMACAVPPGVAVAVAVGVAVFTGPGVGVRVDVGLGVAVGVALCRPARDAAWVFIIFAAPAATSSRAAIAATRIRAVRLLVRFMVPPHILGSSGHLVSALCVNLY